MSDRKVISSTDPYFAGQEGVVQTFDFDYDAIIKYKWELAENWFWGLMCCPLTCPVICLCAPVHYMCEEDNLKDDTRCQHLAVTQDGVRYVQEKHKSGCRMDCEDKGKITKTVPFDKLTDCDIEEPAGAEGCPCCMSNRVLYTVNLDTASGNRGGGEDGGAKHELQLVGLTDPEGFKSLVWQMKRQGPTAGAIPRQQVMPSAFTSPNVIGAQAAPGELAPLIHRTNELLEEIARNTAKR